MNQLARDKAVFRALLELDAINQPVWLEELCKHLRKAGYETTGRGSIVREAYVVCGWFASRPDKTCAGLRIVKVATDRFMLALAEESLEPMAALRSP